MKVEQIANGSLRVWLSEEELQAWGLWAPGTEGRQAMGRFIRRLLRHAPSPGERLQAELIPVLEGGILVLSSVPPHTSPLVYRLPDTEALLALLGQWSQGAHPAYSVYELGEEYRLVIYPDCPLPQKEHWRLSEYGQSLGTGMGAAAYCEERGRLLTHQNVHTDSIQEK